METEEKIKMIEWFDDHWYKIQIDENKYIYVPSVTTKLNIVSKPFLARWRGDVGNREADLTVFEASERGVRIHEAWYTLTTGGVVVYQPFARSNYTEEELTNLMDKHSGNISILRYQDEYYDVFKLHRWLDEVKPKIISSEKMVYRLKQTEEGELDVLGSDAGTLDTILDIEEGKYFINGKRPLELPKGRYVLDLKSGKYIDENFNLQTSKYADCEETMNQELIVGTLILHTGSSMKTGIEGLSTFYRNRDQWTEDLKNYDLASKLWVSRNKEAKPKVFEFPTMMIFNNGDNNGKESSTIRKG